MGCLCDRCGESLVPVIDGGYTGMRHGDYWPCLCRSKRAVGCPMAMACIPGAPTCSTCRATQSESVDK